MEVGQLRQLFLICSEPVPVLFRCLACGAVQSERVQERHTQSTAFFRAFIISCFRDPPGVFVVQEMKMKTDQENTKVRKHEKEESEIG